MYALDPTYVFVLSMEGNPFLIFCPSIVFFALSSLSLNRSAIAIILILVWFDMEVITDVPLNPHPISPIRIAELAFDPKAVEGLIIVKADIAAVFCKKSLLFILILLVSFTISSMYILLYLPDLSLFGTDMYLPESKIHL